MAASGKERGKPNGPGYQGGPGDRPRKGSQSRLGQTTQPVFKDPRGLPCPKLRTVSKPRRVWPDRGAEVFAQRS